MKIIFTYGNNYTIIDNVDRLPEKLPTLFASLTASGFWMISLMIRSGITGGTTQFVAPGVETLLCVTRLNGLLLVARCSAFAASRRDSLDCHF